MDLQTRRQRAADRKASAARIAAAQAEACQAVTSNKCPACGAGVHQNLALTGWVRCDRSGAEGFRRDLTGAACSWQGFTR